MDLKINLISICSTINNFLNNPHIIKYIIFLFANKSYKVKLIKHQIQSIIFKSYKVLELAFISKNIKT